MPEIVNDSKNGSVIVSRYDGLTNGEISQREFLQDSKAPPFNFYRERSNHAYFGEGNFYPNENSSNNLVIFSQGSIELEDVRNAFIFTQGSELQIKPIFDLQEVLTIGKKLLLGDIEYNIPKTVLEKENLPEKSHEEIGRCLETKYGIGHRVISTISTQSKKNGIYYIEGKDGKKYVLKFRSKNREIAEALLEVTNATPQFFPKIFRRTDEPRHTTKLRDGYYGLEEFVEGSSRRIDQDYFILLGNQISTLHKELSDFLESHNGLGQILFSDEGHILESSIASIYLDLTRNIQNHDCFLAILMEIIKDNFSSKINLQPRNLIHRDLNQSNILWKDQSPKIVDSESIRVSIRLNEFIPALLLEGNRARTQYLPRSLEDITESYNEHSQNPLSKGEINILPNLLKYSLLRYYVVRTIRRGILEEDYLKELKKTLKNL